MIRNSILTPIVAPFPTSLQFLDSSDFSDHLARKAKLIKEKVSEIFTNIAEHGPPPPADLQELRSSLTKLLASQKEYMVKFERILEENKELVEQKESLMLRVVKAEKKLDRAKSAAVAKLEQQAIAGTGNSAGSGIGKIENGFDTRGDVANGVKEDDSKIEAAQLAYKEASVLAEKQREQLDAILAENKVLTEQLTAANTRLTSLTEDDYARTELFKTFKSQHEEVIKRINHLEATNIQLREEAEKLQAERTAYRIQVQDEADSITGEIESQLQRLDADLTRVRSTRDELLADQAMRKASQDQERTALDQMKELVGAKDDRITSLESEVQRLRAQLEDPSCDPSPNSEVDELGVEELRKKYILLEQSFASVNNELPAMEKAYKRSMAMASKKVMDFSALEDKVALLIAEKSKADQKYFAARKDMDTRIGEVRALRAQNSKSSEIITQLKEVEASSRSLLTNLEKQLSDLRQANNLAMTEKKRLESSNSDALSKVETSKNQIMELSNLLKTKDSTISNMKQRTHSLESELEQLRTRLEHVQQEKESWKAKSLSNQSGEEEMLRVSLSRLLYFEFRIDTELGSCTLYYLPKRLQKYCVKDLRPYVLQPLR